MGILVGVVALATVATFASDEASATIGPSAMKVPGITGDWKNGDYRNWLKIEGHYWDEGADGGLERIRFSRTSFAGPWAPKNGPGALVIALDKRNPAMTQLMAKCAGKVPLGDLTFAESADQVRLAGELGPLPAGVPQYYEYKLVNVVIDRCPVAADAKEQGFVLRFNDIKVTNYTPLPSEYVPVAAPASAKELSGKTKAYVVSWFAIAGDVSDDQCAGVNTKPEQDDYYAYIPADVAAKERAENDAKGGVSHEDGQMSMRGPGKLNAVLLPGLVKDPGWIMPKTSVARGVDLDGHDGRGKPPAGICAHANYEAPDGRRGIDNQLFRVQGCVPGYQGHKGFYQQYQNEQRRNAPTSLVVEISGIDDEKNDSYVEVTILHSRDSMAKSADGSKILANYTFRPAPDPISRFYTTRMAGRIENGVVVTQPIDLLRMRSSSEFQFHQARLRLEFTPDGHMKGVVAGYQDWRRVMALVPSSVQEQVYGLRAPGMYNALKREADGMKDPATGQCMGISSVYDIEGSPAYVTRPKKSAVQALSK